jgi:hypothetical protein
MDYFLLLALAWAMLVECCLDNTWTDPDIPLGNDAPRKLSLIEPELLRVDWGFLNSFQNFPLPRGPRTASRITQKRIDIAACARLFHRIQFRQQLLSVAGPGARSIRPEWKIP